MYDPENTSNLFRTRVPEKVTTVLKHSETQDVGALEYTKQQSVGRMIIDEVPEREWNSSDEYQSASKHTKSLIGLISKVKWDKKRRTKAKAEKRDKSKQKAKDVELQTKRVEESLVIQSDHKVPSFKVPISIYRWD